jgi:translation initiation factor 1
VEKLPEVCSVCGLPKELCICKTIAKEETKIRVYNERRSFGKFVTIVDGIDEKANPKDMAKKLKTKLAVGGTFKDGRIELRGDNKSKLKALLIELGFPEEKIEVD